MTRPAAERTALWATALGVVVVVACAFAFKDHAVEQYWLWQLESEDVEKQQVAAKWLADMGSVRSVPVMLEKLSRTEFVVVTAYGPLSVDVDLLYPTSSSPSETAMWRKVRIFTNRVQNPADAPNELFLADALWTIAGTSRDTCVPYLTRALDEDAWTVRYLAAALLNRLGVDARAAVPALLAALSRPPTRERAGENSAAQAAGSRGLDVETRDTLFRRQIIRALGSIGPESKTAIPDLTALLNGESESVRQAAAEALRKIRGGEAQRE